MCITPAAVRLQKLSAGIWQAISLIFTLPEQKQNHKSIRMLCGCMKQLYGIDMAQSQYSKTIDKIPTSDFVISMGCDVGCPYIGRAFDDHWGLPDPTGKRDECFIQVIEEIARKIELLREIYTNSLEDPR